jgi:hypothetical protein
MRLLLHLIVVLLLTCTVSLPLLSQSGKHIPQREPSSFARDDDERGFKNAKPPSDVVLDTLLSTPEAKEESERLGQLNREEKRKLFSAVKVYLAGRNEVDEVVIGNSPMSGADNDWFWIVREEGKSARVLLWANGLSLSLSRHRTNGYRDIETAWAAASGFEIDCFYRYDGKQYRLVRRYEHQMQIPEDK